MNLIEEWRFIANIPENAKPCYYDKTLVYITEWFVTLKRRYKGEKAEKGLLYIEDLVKKTEIFIESGKETGNSKSENKRLREVLLDVKIGLNNLVKTYEKDGQENISKKYGDFIIEVERLVNKIGYQNSYFTYLPKIRK